MRNDDVNELKKKAQKDLDHTKKYYNKKNPTKLPEIKVQTYGRIK